MLSVPTFTTNLKRFNNFQYKCSVWVFQKITRCQEFVEVQQLHIEVSKHREPSRPNFPSSYVWTASQLSLVNLGLFSWAIGRWKKRCKKTNNQTIVDILVFTFSLPIQLNNSYLTNDYLRVFIQDWRCNLPLLILYIFIPLDLLVELKGGRGRGGKMSSTNIFFIHFFKMP